MADNGVVAGGRLTDWVSLGVLAAFVAAVPDRHPKGWHRDPVGGELLVASMDDHAVFGPVLHTYPFRRAIGEGG
jgi:hypothetical protein